ncbi:MAG: hypothetical protein WD690_05620 [Vicinamibacterales bacterium]
MNIDRVARAMTGGRPTSIFTARVMAPIHGRPRPDFTARVVARVDGTGALRTRGLSRAALLLIPAAVAIAAGAVVLRSSRATLPLPPDAPAIAAALAPTTDPTGVTILLARTAVPLVTRPTASRRKGAVQQAQPSAPEPAIYMIDALEPPPDIAMKTIEPAAFTIPALDGPAPLRVSDLPATSGGSPSGDSKEKS